MLWSAKVMLRSLVERNRCRLSNDLGEGLPIRGMSSPVGLAHQNLSSARASGADQVLGQRGHKNRSSGNLSHPFAIRSGQEISFRTFATVRW